MSDTFQLDWNLWNAQWRQWIHDHAGDLGPTLKRIGGRNFLADDILGTYEINGRVVELSEVTFPDLGKRPRSDVRFVGITFRENGQMSEGGGVVSTFTELAEVLGIGGSGD